jgi:hypothetical protein
MELAAEFLPTCRTEAHCMCVVVSPIHQVHAVRRMHFHKRIFAIYNDRLVPTFLE